MIYIHCMRNHFRSNKKFALGEREWPKTSYQSGGVYEDSSSAEGNVVAGIKSMPEGTEEKNCHSAMYAIIDNISQPVRCRAIPVVQ